MVEPQHLAALLAAARAVVEAPEVWWCKEHLCTGDPNGCQFSLMPLFQVWEGDEDCRMVEAFILPVEEDLYIATMNPNEDERTPY
jgi:hypothetical protein